MIPAHTTAQQHLAVVVRHWEDLTDALGTPNTVTWPPSGLAAYLTELDKLDADEVAAARQARLEDRADRPYDALGERPVPIRVSVHDTMRTVELALLDLADQIASAVQRPPARIRSAGPGDEIGQRLSLAAAADQADPARWSYVPHPTRTAVFAAVWLQQRLEDAHGPFRPLNVLHVDRITSIARSSAERVESALDMSRRTREVQTPCPHCRGTLRVEGGDGQPPAVRCTSSLCGWKRTAPDPAAA